MWRVGLSLASLIAALFSAHLCFAQLTMIDVGGGFGGAGGSPVTFDNPGTITMTATASTVNYTGLTTAAGARVIIAMMSEASTSDTPTSVTWDPSGANQTFTFLTSQSPQSRKMDSWYLINPSTSGNKTIAYAISSPSGSSAGFFAASFIGGSAVTVGASCGQGVSAGQVINETENATVAANHMGLIYQRGGFTFSNTASWTPTPDQSSNSTTGARPAYLHGTGSFSLKITFDIADDVGHICMDVAP